MQCLYGQIGAVVPLRRNFIVHREHFGSSEIHDLTGRPALNQLAEVLAKSYQRHAGAAPVVYKINSPVMLAYAKDSIHAVGGSYGISARPYEMTDRAAHRDIEIVIHASLLHEAIILAR
jgi:hypothetical protein